MANEIHWTTKLTREAHLKSLIFRRALRSAVVVFLSVIIYQYYALAQGYWISMTALIVVQSTIGATLRKSFQRFLGTLLGVSIAFLLLLLTHNHYIIDLLLLLFLFLAYIFNPIDNAINYGLVVVPLSTAVVLLMSVMNPEKISSVIIYTRLYDTVIGIILGTIGAICIFPNRVKQTAVNSKHYLQKQLADYFEAIMNMFLHQPQASKQANAKKMLIETALLAHQQYCLEQLYEQNFLSAKNKVQERQSLETIEKMAQRLFSLHHMARYAYSTAVFTAIQKTLLSLKTHGVAFLNHHENDVNTKQALIMLQNQLMQIIPKDRWEDIACLSNLHFALSGLITDKNLLG